MEFTPARTCTGSSGPVAEIAAWVFSLEPSVIATYTVEAAQTSSLEEEEEEEEE